MSSSVSNISFRYHPEDEELDDNYDTSSSISTSSITIKPEGNSEENSGGPAGETPNSVLGLLGKRDKREPESDKWKLLTRITKSVEEKIVEIKTERLRSQSAQRRTVPEQSSVSDSEEPSESSQVSVSDKSTKSAMETTNAIKVDKNDETKQRLEPSDSQGSSPERSSTPVVLPEELLDEENDVATKKGKGLKSVLKRKKGKTKHEKSGSFDKTTVWYSKLANDESDSETIEVAQEVQEEISDTQLARELDRLAHPTLFQRVINFISDWHLVLLPLVAVIISHIVNLPQYLVGFVSGVIMLLILQKCAKFFIEIIGLEEPMPSLRDVLPLTGLPIFRRSIYESDIAEIKFEGWMNEYHREYQPQTYHMTLTDTVWVTLEGSQLKLGTPRSKIPKRALWSEPRYKLLFTRERLFDIANCKIELRPEGLIPRRLWSKKYPICIVLNSMSRLGVRYKEKSEETVDEDAPWVEDESKYNFDTLSEDSDEERRSIENGSVGSLVEKNSDNTIGTDIDENLSIDSIAQFSDLETPEVEEAEPDDFVKITPAAAQESVLYLFARTHREKEIWFRRLTAASKGIYTEKTKKFEKITSVDGISVKVPKLDYLSFMMQISQRTTAVLPTNNKEQHSKTSPNSITADLSISSDMMWVNAFMGRVLFDVYQDPNKLVTIQEKIQKKLSAIKLPLFLEQLEVRQLELGETVPVVQRASRPILNAQGVWVDLDVVYEGGFKMTVDTKLNMDRIKQTQAESPTSDSPRTPTPTNQLERKNAAYDSQIEDSAETSSEEPDTTRLQDFQPGTTPLAQSKFIRYLDKVAKNKAFQQVIDYKFIKKFVQGNNLQLEVEVKGLLGTLVLNIPPQPSDRIWFGFRTNPKLWLSANPKFGQHAVAVISRIIEKKLSLEFQRVLVLPNMEDLLVPLMDHNIPS